MTRIQYGAYRPIILTSLNSRRDESFQVHSEDSGTQQGKLTRGQRQYRLLQMENVSLKEQKNSAEALLANTQAAKEDLERRCTHLERDSSGLQDRVHKLETFLADTQSTKDVFERDYARLAKDFSELQNQIHKLESAIENCLEANEEESSPDKLFDLMLQISRLFLTALQTQRQSAKPTTLSSGT